MSRILIPLALGFEEIEAVTNIDILRRAEIEVVTCALDSIDVKGSHNITIKADTQIDEIEIDEFDGILLPGGLPGAENLKNSSKVIEFVKYINKKDGLIAAICAAPIVLEKANVIKDKKVTSYPGFEKYMPSCKYIEKRVVKDGNLITGRGPGVASQFALEVVKYLKSKKEVKQLSETMLIKR
ncbi:MAG: DJ-1/PfpI family protein [Halanaerobiales bacterium]|nr:DJ-1/PfpI family protein [Halanaerobiales bacterium]